MEMPKSCFGQLIGRDNELRQLRTALQTRQSKLIWGAPDAGKTSLVNRAIDDLAEKERRKCIYWTGPASGRQLAAHFIRELYLVPDPFVRKKVHADGAAQATLKRWLDEQSLMRLRGILITAAEQGEYRFFIDHLSPVSLKMAQFMKEIVYRTRTPIYLIGNGYTHGEIGYAWSLYWTNEYRIRLGPLPEGPARQLLEHCIHKFGLASLDLEEFREDLLRVSGHLPGAIVKMCELATDPVYRYGDRIKIKLLHVDYLIRGNQIHLQNAPNQMS